MTGRSRTFVVVLSIVVLVAVIGAGWWVTRSSGEDAHADPTASPTQFLCPMHPQIVQDHPGKCPICGMDLVPAADGQEEEETHEHHGDERVPEGYARVRLTETKARRIGARSVPAEVRAFRREIRAVATVAVDETRLRQVHTKTAGWVERLWADAVGEEVRKGQPLLEIYSPELLAAQEEFRVARRAQAQLKQSASAEVAGSGDALLEAARSRLRLLDMTESEIEALEDGGPTTRTVVLPAPITGTILERGIAQGARVEPGTMLLAVADLSRVWVLASIYEYELPFVREGQDATMTLPFLPGRSFAGRVTKVYPTLDPGSRTAQVRLEFPNAEGALKPDMYAEVLLEAGLGERLSIPAETVMETGRRSLVFVDEGDGVFVPREIEVGLRLPDRVEVLSGLEADERVLAQGNFFVDSESKLRAALDAAARKDVSAPPPGHRH